MCGIAGIVGRTRDHRVDPGVLGAMADSIAHRGPDDSGFFLEPGVGLAHRRLSIIDLGGGHQPLANEDGSAVVVFNGEIYNYAELTARLAASGHRFATRSDTEVIVHGYEERGDDCVLDFRGMFAFALWDARRRRLLLARDRLGIKPLYYHAGRGFLVFASEIKALLEHPEVPREVDPEALDLYLSLRYVPGPRTLFRGIHKLEPGHTLTWDEGGLAVRRYWDLPQADPLADGGRVAGERAVERFAELFEESVRLRLMTEVPLGVFLSGGLDSSAVLATLGRVAPDTRFKAYTVGYAGDSAEERAADEFAWARQAAAAGGAELHELRLTAGELPELLPELVWHLDEPVADPACVPLYAISRRARQDITVVLSGEGADEILGGYSIYRRMLALERLRGGLTPLGPLAPAALAAAGRLLPGERLRHLARLAALPLEERYRGVSRGFFPETRARLLGGGAALAGPGGSAADRVFAAHYAAVAGGSALERMLYVDTKTWLPDDLLVKADKMTMAHGQELRVPFLDHRLVELAATLPAGFKVGGGRGKLLLRRAMAGRVPEGILERSKKGFPVPTGALLRRLGGYTEELLLDPGSACRGHFDPSAVAALVEEHRRGEGRRDQEIWALLVFELWHRVFIDRRLAPARRRVTDAAAVVAAASRNREEREEIAC